MRLRPCGGTECKPADNVKLRLFVDVLDYINISFDSVTSSMFLYAELRKYMRWKAYSRLNAC